MGELDIVSQSNMYVVFSVVQTARMGPVDPPPPPDRCHVHLYHMYTRRPLNAINPYTVETQ